MSIPSQLMLLEDLNTVSWNHDRIGRKRNRRSFFFSSNKDLRCARMTRTRKHLSKRSDIGSAELRKSVRFATAASGQTDYHLRSNIGVEDEDLLEVHGKNDDSVSEDFPVVSSMRPFSI